MKAFSYGQSDWAKNGYAPNMILDSRWCSCCELVVSRVYGSSIEYLVLSSSRRRRSYSVGWLLRIYGQTLTTRLHIHSMALATRFTAPLGLPIGSHWYPSASRSEPGVLDPRWHTTREVRSSTVRRRRPRPPILYNRSPVISVAVNVVVMQQLFARYCTP